VLPQQWQAEAITTATTLSWLAMDDDSSLDGVDSIIYYCVLNRWMVDLQQDEKNNDKLSKPMPPPHRSTIESCKGSPAHNVNNGGMGRHSPWSPTRKDTNEQQIIL
jgi:hypothetical protein